MRTRCVPTPPATDIIVSSVSVRKRDIYKNKQKHTRAHAKRRLTTIARSTGPRRRLREIHADNDVVTCDNHETQCNTLLLQL